VGAGRCLATGSVDRLPSMSCPRPFVPSRFRPARWLPGPHAQTVAGRYARAPRGVRYRRERIRTADGDFLDLDFAWVADAPPPRDGAPVCLVIHGLEGSSSSTYVLESCRVLAGHGIRPVAMNMRSCSGEPNLTPGFYHAGETGDPSLVLRLLAERWPSAPLLAMGFSLGGNQLLKFLGERGDDAPVRAAVAVSVPFDLGLGADKLDASFLGRRYARHFVRRLQAKYRHKLELVGDRVDPERVLTARGFRDFDEAATARLHGFDGAEGYYATCSSRGFVHAIRIPTLLIQAMDDPFVDERGIPHEEIASNPWLQSAFTAHGGHVGFVEGTPLRPRFWAEREAVRFLVEQMEPNVRPVPGPADPPEPDPR
jgi:uncharacterized protein